MQAESNDELAGLGIKMEIPDDISTEKVWEVLLIKIKQPNLFLPVTDVVTRVSDDGLGTYREMSMGPNRIVENIYADESKLEVSFVVIDDPTDHVNIIHTDAVTGTRTLEFYKRNTKTQERVHWSVPAKIGLTGMEKIFDMARTI
jgi:hypothetical protein